MVTQDRVLTVTEFDAYAARADLRDQRLEYIGGEVIDVPSNAFASQLAARISGYIFMYLQRQPIAHLTGEAGGFMVSGERYAPDVAVTLKARQVKLAERGYNPLPPDLAVAVDHPSDAASQYTLRIKMANYLAAGTILWVVRPNAPEGKPQVEVYEPGQPVRIIGRDGSLAGGAVLPGFTLAVRDLFADLLPTASDETPT
jgi:Uma2 family endonuclease